MGCQGHHGVSRLPWGVKIIPHHTIVVDSYGFTLVIHMCLSTCRMYSRPSIFLFPDNILSKYQSIFTKLSMCIDIVEIRLGLLIGKFGKKF